MCEQVLGRPSLVAFLIVALGRARPVALQFRRPPCHLPEGGREGGPLQVRRELGGADERDVVRGLVPAHLDVRPDAARGVGRAALPLGEAGRRTSVAAGERQQHRALNPGKERLGLMLVEGPKDLEANRRRERRRVAALRAHQSSLDEAVEVVGPGLSEVGGLGRRRRLQVGVGGQRRLHPPGGFIPRRERAHRSDRAVDDDQAGDQVGKAGRQLQGDRGAPGVARDDRASQAEGPDRVGRVCLQLRCGVAAGRPVGGSVAPLVQGHDAPSLAPGGEPLPDPGVRAEPVEEQQGRLPRGGLRRPLQVVEPDPLAFDPALVHSGIVCAVRPPSPAGAGTAPRRPQGFGVA